MELTKHWAGGLYKRLAEAAEECKSLHGPDWLTEALKIQLMSVEVWMDGWTDEEQCAASAMLFTADAVWQETAKWIEERRVILKRLLNLGVRP